MYKFASHLLLPLFLINITTSANLWNVYGISIGQAIYWVIIGLACYVGSRTPYRQVVMVTLIIAILLRIMETSFDWGQIELLRKTALAIIFIVAGAKVYGDNLSLLQKQLVVFLALCIPIMLIQILGIDSFFMGWNTEYAHDPTILALDEIGTFKEIAVYPMLFVGVDEVEACYQIGQGRPVGLLYSNNVLSVFISIAVGLNLSVSRRGRLRLSDLIVLCAVVLSMSKGAYTITLILYFIFFIFGVQGKRFFVLKSLALLSILNLLYYYFFPGLFKMNFSAGMLIQSFFTRLLDFLSILGYVPVDGFLYQKKVALVTVFKEGNSYSGISVLLRHDLAVPVLFFVAGISVLYAYRLLKMAAFPRITCVFVLMACFLTQLGIPYFMAPSFQFIAGLALLPLFRRMCQSNGLYRIFKWKRKKSQVGNTEILLE